jgi:hypothetical protein
VVNAKFVFSDGGKWLAAKVLGEKPAQSAVKNNQHIATADIPVPSDFSIPCDGFGKDMNTLAQ